MLVVTHSPQVAARADHHWRVGKTTAGGGARTGVDGARRRRARARRSPACWPGAEVTEAARAAADQPDAGGLR